MDGHIFVVVLHEQKYGVIMYIMMLYANTYVFGFTKTVPIGTRTEIQFKTQY